MLTRRKTLAKTSASFSAALLLLVATGCAQNQKVTTETNANESIVSSTPPFKTKEPERYRATRTITTVTNNGETVVTTNSIARDGERRRVETDLAIRRVVFLYLPEGKFLLVPEEKVFTELTKVDEADASTSEQDSESSPDRLLHTDPTATTYQKLGTETINGRTTQKYRVVVNSSGAENVTVNETFLWFDETLQMPIKTESRSPQGTRYTTELTDIVLDVNKRLFEIPKDWQKIDFIELRKRWENSE